jgi:hypothetical protein
MIDLALKWAGLRWFDMFVLLFYGKNVKKYRRFLNKVTLDKQLFSLQYWIKQVQLLLLYV